MNATTVVLHSHAFIYRRIKHSLHCCKSVPSFIINGRSYKEVLCFFFHGVFAIVPWQSVLFILFFFFFLRYAVVTGANKGIGFEICRKLASNGIVVVLTARDEKKGLEAVEKLREFGLSDHVVFHQLDVADPASIASFADFIKTNYGRLDILVLLKCFWWFN